MRADPETQRAVLAVLDRFVAAVEARDADAALALFSDDADVCSIGSERGELHRGRPALEAFLRRVLAGPAGYSWEWRSRKVSAAGAVAWVVAETTARVSSPGGVRRSAYVLTAVLERRDGAWRIQLFHGSEPAAPEP